MSSLIQQIKYALEHYNDPVMLLNGNASGNSFLAIGARRTLPLEDDNDPFEALDNFLKEGSGWAFGYLGYDLKNQVERLTSQNQDQLGFPVMHFFEPEFLFYTQNGKTNTLLSPEGTEIFHDEAVDFSAILEEFHEMQTPDYLTELTPRVSKENYLKNVRGVQGHIQRGDIYELNYCQEFFAENTPLPNPARVYRKLNKSTQAPYSVFFKMGLKTMLGASPERFLNKQGLQLISEPIKGTAPRGKTLKEDERLKLNLLDSQKERSENVMITDLVRNDLSRVALRGSVKVPRLFEIRTFETVHQMVSTVTCSVDEKTKVSEIFRATFPMGSMTGAPKIRSMELIEDFEETKRGLYSGAVGYFTPTGNFDFNVVIRSILHNAENNYISAMVGGAITALSDPEAEYEECLTKAKALFEALV